MAQLPDSLRLTAAQEAELKQLQAKAKVAHELRRKAAAKQGRRDFPDFPYECSWAFETEFTRKVKARDSI